MNEPVEFDAKLTQYRELYNHDCPDGVRYAGWELTLLFDKPPHLEGTDFKVAFTPVPEPKPDPPPEPPSWADAPNWAWHRAQHKSGRWCWYEKYPTSGYVPGTDFWSSAGRIQMSVLDAPNPNWQDTLGQRPDPAPLCPICSKPASEHRDGLWCCGHCGGEAALGGKSANPWVRHVAACVDCGVAVGRHCKGDVTHDWNRRA